MRGVTLSPSWAVSELILVPLFTLIINPRRSLKIPEANLVLLTGLFGARANARVPTRRAGKHACTGLVHLDAKFRIRRSILGKFRSNFDLEGHTGREFEWYEYLGIGLEGFAKLCVCCAETMKLSNCRENDGFFRETIETIGSSAQRCY